ncbi:MAG: hypothetical protein IJU23_05635 [Proteobacteria bacterium]|nr:hypothetical protein [Pseudomonadota bacterium]
MSRLHPILWLLVLTASTYCSCSLKPNTTDEKPPVETPPKAEDVILAAENMHLTITDYDQCLAILKFEGFDFSIRALANPRFQRDEIQRCYQIGVMRQYAKKNNLAASTTERQQALRAAYERFGVQSESALAQKLKMTPESLNAVIDDSLLAPVVQKHLASTLDDKAIKERLNRDFRVFSLEMGVFDNTPTQEEADAFLKTDEQTFSVYIGAHQEVLKTQPYAQFVRMAYPLSDNATHKAAEELRLTASQQGLDKALEKCQAEESCSVVNGKDDLFDIEKTEAIAWAFKATAGAVSELIKTDKTEEIWVLQDTKPPRLRDAKDPQVRRETAVEVMAILQPAPHLIQPLKAEIEAEKTAFKTIVENHHGQFIELKDTPYMDLIHRREFPSGVLKVLADMKREEVMLFSSPVLSDKKMYVFQVLQLKEPSENDFATQKEKWIEKAAADPSFGLVDEWMQKTMPRMSSINIRPISEKYGTLQTDGSVRF